MEPATVTVTIVVSSTGAQTPPVANTLNVVVVANAPVESAITPPVPATGVPTRLSSASFRS
ncbi:MAG: hypothetical protein DYG99_13885 [Bacteroidetes bacterium CHB5]|nr:hypothetical protein [Bacteroidetes bacterium CHB5]